MKDTGPGQRSDARRRAHSAAVQPGSFGRVAWMAEMYSVCQVTFTNQCPYRASLLEKSFYQQRWRVNRPQDNNDRLDDDLPQSGHNRALAFHNYVLLG